MFCPLSIGLPDTPSQAELLYHRRPDRHRQKLEHRKYKVRLNWKVPVGGLHKVSLPNSADLRRHFGHLFLVAHVFDNRIGIDNIELGGVEASHIASVTDDAVHIFVTALLLFEIENRNVNVRLIDKPDSLPDRLRATNVQDF